MRTLPDHRSLFALILSEKVVNTGPGQMSKLQCRVATWPRVIEVPMYDARPAGPIYPDRTAWKNQKESATGSVRRNYIFRGRSREPGGRGVMEGDG